MLQTIQEHWDEILQLIRYNHNVSLASYDTWLMHLHVKSVDENAHMVHIAFENPLYYNSEFVIKHITKNYSSLFQIYIEQVTGFVCEVDIYMEKKEEKVEVSKPKKTIRRKAESEVSSPNSNLNPKYTFDNFVVGSSNEFAHATCLAIAEAPATKYNPFFIYGGAGLGKTHLMHSIGNFIIKNDPSQKVMYVTSERFTNELIDSIRSKSATSVHYFREKYRNNDVLLIDDIQFIIGKESTQEEIFHTFNALHEAGKQIVFSSDRPPRDFETALEDRLLSRFKAGPIADIKPPNYETRMAILRKKEEIEGYNIDNEVIHYIANNITSNIRELEGALTKVVALGRLNKKEVDLPLAEEALKDLISPNHAQVVTPEVILGMVADHYGCKTSDILSNKRLKEIIIPRHMVMYLCRQMTDSTLQSIGKFLGGRDHSTVKSGINNITQLMENDRELKNTVEVLKKKISFS